MRMALVSSDIGNLLLSRENRSKGHPRFGSKRLLAPSIAFDCARHSTRAMIYDQRSTFALMVAGTRGKNLDESGQGNF